jgi:hypothetical protein
MPREFIIAPTRFTARLERDKPQAWQSQQHDLMYSVAGRPRGADRSSDFTVSSFVQMTFNKPLPQVCLLSVRGAPVLSYAGITGAQQDLPPAVNILSQQGVFLAFDGTIYYGPPLPQYGSSFQTIQFPAGRTFGNLGQSVLFQAVFVAVPPEGERYVDIDVTFRGALLSSDPV